MNWTDTTLGELITFQRGKDLPKADMKGGIYPVVGSNGIIGWHNQFTTEAPGITIGRSGSTGHPFLCETQSWSHNTTLYIKNYRSCAPRFIYYFLQTLHLNEYAGGSAVPTLNRNHIHSISVRVPDIKTQERIAAVLSCVDDKIRANAQLNGYLEELLLAQYDELFPGSSNFDGTLSDVGDIIGGATPSKKKPEYYCSEGIGWITPHDLSNTSDKFIAHGADDITDAGYASCSAKLLSKGSVLFSSRAPIGYVAIATDKVATNQGFKSVIPKKEVGTAFVYCFLVRNKQRIADMGAGTTFPEVSGKMMKSVELSIPNQRVCDEFNAFAGSILKQQETLERESRELGALRDALLPKLMSGKIDVSKVDLTQLNSHLVVFDWCLKRVFNGYLGKTEQKIWFGLQRLNS